MGVRINGGAGEDAKPLFESSEPKSAAEKVLAGEAIVSPKKMTRADAARTPEIDLPECFSLAIRRLGKGWQPVSTIPRDRVILIAWSMKHQPAKRVFYEVMWFQAPGFNSPGWMICGTQWHRLDEAMIDAWMDVPEDF